MDIQTEVINKLDQVNPKVRDILIILGATGFIAATLLIPGLPIALKPLLKNQYKKIGHFNKRILRYQLKRLQKNGIVELIEQDGELMFKLTNRGKHKLFKYKLEELSLNRRGWDKKWRLVAYDIPKYKKSQAEAFRSLLKKMEFLNIQKSLWLTPYNCKDEITFLKNLYNLEDHVSILTVSGLEGEALYKDYFGV